MSEVPAGRCMVCRNAWDPCRVCRGKVLRSKQQETMRRNGTVVTPKPSNFGRFTLERDTSLFKHEVAHYKKEDNDAQG